MQRGLVAAELVIGLNKLPDLTGIHIENRHLRIGAMTTLEELAAAPAVQKYCTALHDAAAAVGAPPIRHVATIGGNICQNSRCLFYNQSEAWRKEQAACLKAGGDRCLAVPGSKRCFSVYQGDLAPAIIALGGELVIQKKGASRRIAAEGFFTGKGERPVDLADNEVVTELFLPLAPRMAGSSYRKMRMRPAIDYPITAAAVLVTLNGDETVGSARVVLGATGPAPVIATAVSEAIVGTHAGSADLDALVTGITKGTRMVDNLSVPASYRRKVTAVFAKRALRAALESAGGKENR
jgi:4-hydroxybenzoyl-CoA reductase beta subunit